MALRRSGRGLLVLSPVLLAGCFPDNDTEHVAVRDAREIPPVRQQIDRSLKGDRLAVAERAQSAPLPRPRTASRGGMGKYAALENFYRALGDLKTGMRSEPVTVLHLGDSHIAADRFSGDLRDLFQARFGDAGRGMMMPGYPFPYYKARGISFSKNGNWEAANSLQGDPGPYGLSGVRVSSRTKKARLSLDVKDGVAEWAEVAFARRPDGGDATVTFGGAQRLISTRGAEGGAVRARIESKGRSLSIVTKSSAPVSVLSWAVGQNRPGLRYVNFGIPGATADTPRRWSPALVADGLERLKPDLIVLGYGTNEGFNDALDISAYEARANALIAQLRDAAPQASVLIMGPPDSARLPRFARKGVDGARERCADLEDADIENYTRLKALKSRKLAQWHAPPNLASVRRSLQNVASATKGYFWDWSKVMGGPCGIHAWAQASPPLAASDRVHLRPAGAKRSAQVLFDEVMAGYEAHVRLASR